jgi:hypothetical protein
MQIRLCRKITSTTRNVSLTKENQMVKLIVVALLLVGCSGGDESAPAPTCTDITREFTVGVPYQWDVMETEDNTVMDNGCTLHTITNYVLDDGSGGGGAGGSGPDPKHCDVDACGGPNDKRATYSDPAPDAILNATSVMSNGQDKSR